MKEETCSTILHKSLSMLLGVLRFRMGCACKRTKLASMFRISLHITRLLVLLIVVDLVVVPFVFLPLVWAVQTRRKQL